MTALVGLWLVLQGGSGGWTATPARPTVGDTVWLERQVVVPAGWRVRAGRLEATEAVEALGDPSVRRGPAGWLVRYPIVAWTPGAHTLALPPIWELRSDGRADSVSGGVAGFFVQSVIPDSVLGPEPGTRWTASVVSGSGPGVNRNDAQASLPGSAPRRNAGRDGTKRRRG